MRTMDHTKDKDKEMENFQKIKEQKISLLSSQVSSQIAAGEVVERPSHLVKELLENSLDAQSTEIELDFDEGGRRIRLKDNGVGIKKEDLVLALTRHATSKIRNFSDLLSLTSFGFRGEALASIASVSKLTLTSRPRGSPKSFRVKSQFGDLSPIEECSAEEGSLITVEDLFARVPARLKFLKSETTEFQQIRNTIKALAMAHHKVSFRIRSKSKLLYFWPASPLLFPRVQSILERKALLFYEHKDTHQIRLRVALGSPQDTFPHSKHLWFFVNNRWVQNRTLQAALLNAYDRLLMKKEFPVAALFLDCSPDFVDVNIHPNKSQVKFQENSLVFTRVLKTVREGLLKNHWLKGVFPQRGTEKEFSIYEKSSSMPPISKWEFKREGEEIRKHKILNEEKKGFHFIEDTKKEPKGKALSFDSNQTPRENSNFQSQTFKKDEFLLKENFKQDFFQKTESQKSLSLPSWSSLDILGQAHLTYIVAQSESSLIFLDQHAVHERICYEKYRTAIKEKKGFEVQSFLLPYEIKMEENKVQRLQPLFSDLEKMFGLHLDSMGPSQIVLRSAPLFIKPESLPPVLELLSVQLEEEGGSFALERKLGDITAEMACHSAIRAGQSLKESEMRALLVQMEEFSFSSFCPHGRPVFVEYPFSRLEREFKRTL